MVRESMTRKYIPILTRCLVARRQIRELGGFVPVRPRKRSLTVYFEIELLPRLEAALGSPLQLDHRPALGLRRKRTLDDGSIEYSPRENDYRFMAYQCAPEHLQKTTGRRPGAERTVTSKGSDIWLMQKFRRLEGPKKRKRQIRSGGFAKHQKRRFS